MKFIEPEAEELSLLRADPILVEQELDVRPEVAQALERALGARSGRFYWRSDHDHLYALELWDAGRGRPSAATVYGHWDRYEPRPPEHELDLDLASFLAWVSETAEGLERKNFERVVKYAELLRGWPDGSVLRTPDERFDKLPDFPYEPHYLEIEGLRMAWVEAGQGDPILMLHGEPTWGFLYRHMIPPLAKHGRVIVPDLIGFGRSDKPTLANAYSYRSHARWLRKFVSELDLRAITLVAQDWGGLLGLRLLAQEPERFARVVAMNTGLPDGRDPGPAFRNWLHFSQQAKALPVGEMLRNTAQLRTLSDAEVRAYDAPFPSPDYQVGALVFPRLLPLHPQQLAAYENRQARARLARLELPALLPWGDADPILGPWEPDLRQLLRPSGGALAIKGAGHFVQEDAGAEVAEHIQHWLGEH